MIKTPAEYRYVTGPDMQLVRFDGRIMPLRGAGESVLRGEDIAFLLEAGQVRSNAVRGVREPHAYASWTTNPYYLTGTRVFDRRISGIQARDALSQIYFMTTGPMTTPIRWRDHDLQIRETAYLRDLAYINYDITNIVGIKAFALTWNDVAGVGPGAPIRLSPIERAFATVEAMRHPMVIDPLLRLPPATPTNTVIHHGSSDSFSDDGTWGYASYYQGNADSGYFSGYAYYTHTSGPVVEFDVPGVTNRHAWGMLRISYLNTYRTTQSIEAAVVVDLTPWSTSAGDIFSVSLPQETGFVDKVAGMVGATLDAPPPTQPSSTVNRTCLFSMSLEQVICEGDIDNRTTW